MDRRANPATDISQGSVNQPTPVTVTVTDLHGVRAKGAAEEPRRLSVSRREQPGDGESQDAVLAIRGIDLPVRVTRGAGELQAWAQRNPGLASGQFATIRTCDGSEMVRISYVTPGINGVRVGLEPARSARPVAQNSTNNQTHERFGTAEFREPSRQYGRGTGTLFAATAVTIGVLVGSVVFVHRERLLSCGGATTTVRDSTADSRADQAALTAERRFFHDVSTARSRASAERSPTQPAVVEQVTQGTACFEKGLRFFWQHDYGQAIGMFDLACRYQSTEPTYRYFLALSQFLAGRREAAETNLALAVELEAEYGASDMRYVLQRVQGPHRMWMENARKDAKLGSH